MDTGGPSGSRGNDRMEVDGKSSDKELKNKGQAETEKRKDEMEVDKEVRIPMSVFAL